MKHFFIAAVAAAMLGIALPAAAQNIAIVNGKPVPKTRSTCSRPRSRKAAAPSAPRWTRC